MNTNASNKINKLRFVDESGASSVVYIARSLKAYSLDDLVREMKSLQIIKYPETGNYCLIPANEEVPLGIQEWDLADVERRAQEMQYNDAVSQAEWERENQRLKQKDLAACHRKREQERLFDFSGDLSIREDLQ